MKRIKRNPGILALVLVALATSLSLGHFAQATPPGRINYQGVLRTAAVPGEWDRDDDLQVLRRPTAGVLLWRRSTIPRSIRRR